MGNLIDKIQTFKYYEKEFKTWNATEQIIDDTKAFWCLNKPNSQFQKVCLYRDGCNMFVYGDYGQFTFDSMTWTGSVHNLAYDNIGYQFEKLSYNSKQSLKLFDADECEKDIYEWLEYQLGNEFKSEEDVIEIISEFKKLYLNGNCVLNCDIEEFCEEHNRDDLYNLFEFVNNCLDNIDEYEWISFLRSSNLEDFDEVCESGLWDAGKVIDQRYYICLYALKVCSKKLIEKFENSKIEVQ